MKQFWRDHNLPIVLLGVLILMLISAWFLGLPEWTDQQKHSNQSTSLWPGYWAHYGYDVVVSILADVWGPFLLVMLGLKLKDRKSNMGSGA